MSTDETPAKRGRGRPPRITVQPRRDEGTWSAEDVLQARLVGNNPFGHTNENDVPMRDRAAWHQRWFNTLSSPAQLHRARHVLGWEPMTVADLPDGQTIEALGYTVGPDGTIRRGARDAEEILFKMPESAYRQIQTKKSAANTKGMRSPQAAKAETSEALAASHGDEAAEFINKHGSITITDSQRPI